MKTFIWGTFWHARLYICLVMFAFYTRQITIITSQNAPVWNSPRLVTLTYLLSNVCFYTKQITIKTSQNSPVWDAPRLVSLTYLLDNVCFHTRQTTIKTSQNAHVWMRHNVMMIKIEPKCARMRFLPDFSPWLTYSYFIKKWSLIRVHFRLFSHVCWVKVHQEILHIRKMTGFSTPKKNRQM